MHRQTSTCCSLLGYSAPAYYQFNKTISNKSLKHDLLLQEVSKIRLEMKKLGTRKLYFKLENFMASHQISIGRDGFFNLLRENNLLIKKRKRNKPKTTYSNHWMRKYPNLIIGFIPLRANQLWVSDITYISILDKFAYLSLITDAYSHKIIGYKLAPNMEAIHTLEALKMAIKFNPNCKEAIHHSDRGSQYCSAKYINALNSSNIQTSMTQTGDPKENALAERVNGILKDEFLNEVFLTFDIAKKEIDIAISIYNHHRPHNSIGNLTPNQAHLLEGELEKKWKNYYKHKQPLIMSE